ncbi:DAK2 domain-containing protein [Lederbergia sp. NSJ-179]|uniref:DAK2 domain-containing protein n=1 Tax=Lederbergia sp. NSJ-179 TaxID=2931402 RepID=UPI001FD1DE97|nr:DAK2 domain-containing protein [Lederbergia sp. NSJ-179]MCJ7839603.1 DAK2 domain-containing protein [Lederbergia sp. NSJ-179]
MAIQTLDGNQFAEMILKGANHLEANAQMVDALNVFPVPDGDTGTNMNLSMTSGSKEVQKNKQAHIGKVAMALSKGLLMGARGNSGVILSQLFRGFAKEIEHKSFLDASEFASAFEAGVKTAYKAVMKPVEGTILTVAKDSAKKAVEIAKAEKNIIVIMEAVLQEAKASLKRTPDLLPVLKEVGVVDSGGQGLVCVYEGFLASLKGESLPNTPALEPSMDELVNAQHHQSVQGFLRTEDIVYGYCTEFMVKFENNKKKFSEQAFQEDLSHFGDSLLVISDDEVVKVHIHSEEPGKVLSYGQQYGSLINMKIENMREQHSSILEKDRHQGNKENAGSKEKQPYAIIAVSMGSGIAELFKSIGASRVIEGGQTMNPSTEDIVKAIQSTQAEKILLLPNNKNIIMAAEQAAQVVEEEVLVVPTKTVPQGLAAILAFNPSASLEQNGKGMKEASEEIKTGQITYAVRDTVIDGLSIQKDDYMGIHDGKIVEANQDLTTTAQNLLKTMIDDDSEILTILYGEDTQSNEVDQLVDYLNEHYEDLEVEVHNGKQPLYPYIFSVE